MGNNSKFKSRNFFFTKKLAGYDWTDVSSIAKGEPQTFGNIGIAPPGNYKTNGEFPPKKFTFVFNTVLVSSLFELRGIPPIKHILSFFNYISFTILFLNSSTVYYSNIP
jgi:hypothetical protein